jgi:hypothetical protein
MLLSEFEGLTITKATLAITKRNVDINAKGLIYLNMGQVLA